MLRIDLDELWQQVRRVTERRVDFEVNLRAQQMDPIDVELRSGKEVFLSDIDFEGGLLLHKGRQVLLYIRDHSGFVAATVADPEKGRRFHVSHCSTLEEMRANRRFERYVATNDLSGVFHILDERGGWPSEGYAALKVCQNCLSGLNYKDARRSSAWRRHLVDEFSLGEFFSTYSSCFTYMPRRWNSDPADTYTDDWDEVSRRIREERGYRCESCEIRLIEETGLCHVHHIDGVKANNDPGNLQVLCAACHRERPGHHGLFVRRGDMQAILRLRREQNLVGSGWEKVLEEVDPAVRGSLMLLKQYGAAPPQIGIDVLDERGVVVDYAEAGWPDRQIGICVKRLSESAAWALWPFAEVLQRPHEFVHILVSRSS